MILYFKFLTQIGIFDLLLHKRDVAYSAKTLQEWLSMSHMKIVRSIDDEESDDRYSRKVKILIKDPNTRKSIWETNIIKHSFYATSYDTSVNLIDFEKNYHTYRLPHTLRNYTQNKRNFQKVFSYISYLFFFRCF